MESYGKYSVSGFFCSAKLLRFFHIVMCDSGFSFLGAGDVVLYYINILQFMHSIFDGHFGF